ncbi:MAG: hypothetical protein IJM30_11395 [Thermoguttaceae bacterium]|nr:hypothetical protein [Thermoguttaceae bacterium]
MSSPREANVSLKNRALEALGAEIDDPTVSSAFSEDGQYLLLADSLDDGKGVELFVEFSAALSEPPESLDSELALFAKNRALFEGALTTRLSVDGEPLRPTAPAEILCQDFDSDRSFVETSVPLTGGRRFSRRFLLARNESLLLILDEFSGSEADRENSPAMENRAFFPLSSEVEVLEDEEARELALRRRRIEEKAAKKTRVAKKKLDDLSEEERLFAELYSEEPTEAETFENLAGIFPLALPEWKADKSRGELVAKKRPFGLELTSRRNGGSLVSALLIDLNARRVARPRSWRPLTVGENMEVAPEDSAVGYKIQLGREQYLLYASTSPRPAIRSVLGRNLLSDFMFGKFTAKRGVEPIVDVEIDQE